MVQKIVTFDVALKSTERQWVQKVPEVYTNDLGSVTIQFKVTDCTDVELTNSTAIVLLKMRDGSFFQGPSPDVGRTLNVFSYNLKENEGNHDGLAEIQLVVTIAGKEFGTQKYNFKVISGLDSEVAREIMIHDWTTLTAEARAYIDQFTADELVRDAEFDNTQFDRNVAFNSAQGQRSTDFGTDQAQRVSDFNAAEAARVLAFNNAEAARAAGYDADHSRAETDHTGATTDRTNAATDRTNAATDRTNAAADRTLAGTDHTTAAGDHTQALANNATVAGFNARVVAEETATANNKVSAVKGKTFADVDARFEDLETDTTVMASNLVTNGDFSNGSVGWSVNGGTMTVTNNEATITSTSLGGSVGPYRGPVPGRGNKMYVSGEIYPKYSTLTMFGFNGGETISFYPTPNTWNRKSAVLKNNASSIVFYHMFSQGGYVITDTIRLRRLFTIDLTATFGAGNEPTVEQMDAIMAKFENSWFDGTKNLFQAKASLNKLMELDARTEFEARNIPINGSFEGSLSPWVTYGTSATGLSVRDISTSKKVSGTSSLYVKRALGESAGYGYQQKVNIISGSKVYLRASGYIPASSLSPVSASVGIEGVPYGYITFLPSVKDAWQHTSTILTPTATGSVNCILQLVSNATYDGECYFDDIIIIDLTATFGAGKEPTLAEMDRLMARFPNSWFDGVKPIQTIETLYQEKANKVQEAWITPTLQNGATGDIQYRKNQQGRVEFRGSVSFTTDGLAVFSMPIGYRLLAAATFPLAIPAAISITSTQRNMFLNGGLNWYPGYPLTSRTVDFTGISYVAEA